MGWLSGWKYRKSHIIHGSTAGAVTDYQIKIVVHYGSGTDSGEDVYLDGKCRTNFGDIRFTADDGETELTYGIVEKVDGDYAVVWVKIPNIPEYPNTEIIYIYYGKSDATTTSNRDLTFLWFENFESYNTGNLVGQGGWTQYEDRTSALVVSDVTWEGNRGVEASHDHRAADHSLPLSTDVKVMLRWRLDDRGYSTKSDAHVRLVSGGSEIISVGHKDNTRTKFYYDDGTKHWTDKTLNLSTWYKFEFRVSSTAGIEWLVDDEVLASITDTSADTFRLYADEGCIMYLDLLIVVKYVSPEPSHGAWGSEERVLQVTLSQSELTVRAGESGSVTVTVEFDTPTPPTVSLSAENVPDGVSVNFNPSSGTPSFSSTMTINVSSITHSGRYVIRVKASCSYYIAYAYLMLLVPPKINLTARNLPSGVSYSFIPSKGYPSFNSTLRITVSRTTVAGTYSIKIVASGGWHYDEVYLTLIVLEAVVVKPTDLLNQLDQIISRLRYVSYGDKVELDDMKDKVEAVKLLIQIARAEGCNESYLTLAENQISMLESYYKPSKLGLISNMQHNLLVEALKYIAQAIGVY